MKTLSVVYLVRDESAKIGASIRSLAALVPDEIVLGLDTRTTEPTAIKAARAARDLNLSLVVVPVEWDDDFGCARNTAIEKASGDWILTMDADLHFVGGDASGMTIRRWIEMEESKAAEGTWFETGASDAPEGECRMLHLFAQGAYYEHRIHETIDAWMWGERVAPRFVPQLQFQHSGVRDPASRAPKELRNKRLLDLEWNDGSDLSRIHALYYLLRDAHFENRNEDFERWAGRLRELPTPLSPFLRWRLANLLLDANTWRPGARWFAELEHHRLRSLETEVARGLFLGSSETLIAATALESMRPWDRRHVLATHQRALDELFRTTPARYREWWLSNRIQLAALEGS